jgi:hypothetical protein
VTLVLMWCPLLSSVLLLETDKHFMQPLNICFCCHLGGKHENEQLSDAGDSHFGQGESIHQYCTEHCCCKDTAAGLVSLAVLTAAAAAAAA